MPWATNGIIPAEMVDIMYTDVTSYHLMHFTMRALHIPSQLPYPMSYWNLCVNSNHAIFFHFILFIQFLGYEKAYGQDKNGFDFKHQSERDYFHVSNILLS